MSTKGLARQSLVSTLLPKFGLLAFLVILVLSFSLALPSSFPTILNFRSIVSANSITAILALASMLPIAAGKYDISLGYGTALSEVLSIYFITKEHLAWPLVVLVILAIGAIIGVVNGLLVEVAQIDSFIATLGTGSLLYGIMLAISGGNEILGSVPNGFQKLDQADLGQVPVSLFYVLALVAILWAVLEHTPMGRYLYAVGSNPSAARLNGIASRRYVLIAFVSCDVLTALAGILLASQQTTGQPSIGNSYLLPALVGALLGTTAIKPGRANAWGTLVAIATLAAGISGLEQFGSNVATDSLFDGFTLLVAVAIAGVASRRRASGRTTAERMATLATGASQASSDGALQPDASALRSRNLAPSDRNQ